MKIVINKCYGGFSLSLKGQKEYLKLVGKEVFFYKQTKYSHHGDGEEYTKVGVEESGFLIYAFTKDFGDTYEKLKNKDWEKYYFSGYDMGRDDPNLISVVEKLGKEANGRSASLEIVEIPDGTNWHIDEYDGMESIDEDHRSWY